MFTGSFFNKNLVITVLVALLMGVVVLIAIPSSHVVGVLEVDVENITTYIGDTSDYSKVAGNPTQTPVAPKSFAPLYGIGDIVRVNGRPAKGTWTVFTGLILLAPVEVPGIAIADTFRGGIAVSTLEILNTDFSPRGSVMMMGLAGGPAPPLGGAIGLHFGNMAITGGTGEFIGAKGVMGETTNPLEAFRFASNSEDPSTRRALGGGKLTFVLSMSN
jgi:hypothetical protein